MKILSMLRENARDISYRKMGREVGLSVVGARRRVKKLEKLGIITGYTAMVDEGKLGNQIAAFLTVEFAHDGTDLFAKLKRGREVREAYRITGKDSAIVKLYTKDVVALNKLVEDLGQLDCVKSVAVAVVLEKIKEGRSPSPLKLISYPD